MKDNRVHKTFESFKDSIKLFETSKEELDQRLAEAWERVAAVIGFIHTKTSYSSPSLKQNMPFFSSLMSKLKPIMTYDKHIKTMATDGKRVYINPNFVFTGANGKPLSQRQIFFIYCHEILHNALVHFARRGHRNPKLWNYATDYEINPMLVQQGIISADELKKEIRGLYEEKYVGKPAEEIYDILEKEIEKRSKNKPPKPQPKPAEAAKVGDYISIKGQNKYAKVISVNGDDYEVEEVSIDEVRQAKKNGLLKKAQ